MEYNQFFGYCKWFAKATGLLFVWILFLWILVIAVGDALFSYSFIGFLAIISAWSIVGMIVTGLITCVFFLVALIVNLQQANRK